MYFATLGSGDDSEQTADRPVLMVELLSSHSLGILLGCSANKRRKDRHLSEKPCSPLRAFPITVALQHV